MDRETSADSTFGMGTPRSEAWIDPAWTMGLWVAAIVLFTVSLGNLPLRDWDEGIVAQIAREIARSPFESLTWLYPQDLSGNPYFNKPPLVHWLVALSYHLGGVSETTSRLPGALLTAASVPTVYWIGREVFFQRSAAVFAASVYLTSLPVVRQGRLAMLDGAVLCFFTLMMLCLLRSRRNLRWGLGVGFCFGLICLTKGILGVLLLAIGLIFIGWDTPRLLTSGYLWSGFLLGCAPVALWYGAQWQKYGAAFINTHLFDQSLKRVSDTVSNNQGPVWFYALEVAKHGVPWLLFLPQGFRHAWENRTLSWAKLALVWSGIYFAVISIMQTKLPWYAMPLYPALSLVVGAQLNRIWQMPTKVPYRPIAQARFWVSIFSVLALVAWLASAYYGFKVRSQPDVQLVFSTLALTFTVAMILIARQDTQFIPVLIWGTYLTLVLFVLSNHWVWELEEAYPVKPVAAMLKQTTPKGKTVYTSYPYFRPSLNFYSDRVVVPASEQEWQTYWREDPHPYILLELPWLGKLPPKQTRVLGMSENWIVITRTESPSFKPTITASR